jgi:hypothetical protein
MTQVWLLLWWNGGKKKMSSALLQSFMAMIVNDIWVNWFGFIILAHLAALSVILYLILSSVGPNTAWSLANHTVSIIRFIPS